MQALEISIVPKLVVQDLTLFKLIINDLFPKLTPS